jgi:hypothetical protein
MKKRILGISMALVLIAVMALPMAVLAQSTDDTDIIGTLGADFTLVAPTNFTWSAFVVGTNTGSATAGSISTNTTGWTLTVADAKTNTNGYMTIDGLDVADTNLTNDIQVGMTAPTVSTIATYEDQLQAVGTYGDPGTFSIPLFGRQVVTLDDAAETYQITLTYTATPGT